MLWLCICSDDNLPVTWLYDGKGRQLWKSGITIKNSWRGTKQKQKNKKQKPPHEHTQQQGELGNNLIKEKARTEVYVAFPDQTKLALRP